MFKLEKWIKFLVIAGILYLVFTDPHGSANTATSILHWLKGAFQALGVFVDALRAQS